MESFLFEISKYLQFFGWLQLKLLKYPVILEIKKFCIFFSQPISQVWHLGSKYKMKLRYP